MKDFLKELRLALEDYFCGTFTETEEGIQVELKDGKKFLIVLVRID